MIKGSISIIICTIFYVNKLRSTTLLIECSKQILEKTEPLMLVVQTYLEIKALDASCKAAEEEIENISNQQINLTSDTTLDNKTKHERQGIIKKLLKEIQAIILKQKKCLQNTELKIKEVICQHTGNIIITNAPQELPYLLSKPENFISFFFRLKTCLLNDLYKKGLDSNNLIIFQVIDLHLTSADMRSYMENKYKNTNVGAFINNQMSIIIRCCQSKNLIKDDLEEEMKKTHYCPNCKNKPPSKCCDNSELDSVRYDSSLKRIMCQHCLKSKSKSLCFITSSKDYDKKNDIEFKSFLLNMGKNIETTSQDYVKMEDRHLKTLAITLGLLIRQNSKSLYKLREQGEKEPYSFSLPFTQYLIDGEPNE